MKENIINIKRINLYKFQNFYQTEYYVNYIKNDANITFTKIKQARLYCFKNI